MVYSDEIDRLEEMIRNLAHERSELESAIERGREVAREIRSAANTAGEVAGMISMEVGWLRRG